MIRFIKVLLLALALGTSALSQAQTQKSAWAISIDNDLFTPTGSDRDFTAGLAVTYSGRDGLDKWRTLDESLALIDSITAKSGADYSKSNISPSIEVGSYGFTPEAIQSQPVITDDRPFASLVYVSSSRIYHHTGARNAWSSSLTLGFLGLDIVKSVQNRIHGLTGSKKVLGWSNQISDGGEPTFRYQLAYHRDWHENTANLQLKTTYFSSIGYLTEAGVALSTRNGLISSPSHRFNPELISYGERVNDLVATPNRGQEDYFWGGIAFKVRAYNAFLQGQFRHSEHSLNKGQVNYLLAETWAGYTLSFEYDFKLSYVLRAQTSEVRQGKANRALIWGGLVLSQTL